MKDGGTAFPATRLEHNPTNHNPDSWVPRDYPGMSLRDYFAAHAVEAVTAYMGRHANHEGFIGEQASQQIAVNAYALADAMLKAREGRDS